MKLLSLMVSLICGFAIAFAASEGDVRHSLEVRGIPGPDAIELPQTSGSAGCDSMEANVQAVAGNSLWVRFRCRGNRQPFYAVLTYQSRETRQQAKAQFAANIVGSKNRLPIVIRAGQLVQLVLRSGGVVLRQPVISLQAGRLGQRIRVRNEAQKIYLASVKGEKMVEGEL